MNQASQILAEVKKAVCGKDRVLVWVLTVILARGHILLEDIPGVGEKRRQALLRKFRSVRAISQAELQQLEEVLPAACALAVYQHFHPKEEGEAACASSQEPPEVSR